MALFHEKSSLAGADVPKAIEDGIDTQPSSPEHGRAGSNSTFTIPDGLSEKAPSNLPTISAAQIRLLISAREIRKGHLKLPTGQRSQQRKFQGWLFFGQLRHEEDFSNLKEVLQAYVSLSNPLLLKVMLPVRLRIDGILTLAMNDFMARSAVIGMWYRLEFFNKVDLI